MVKEQKEIESVEEDIKFFPMNITKDKKQVSVRIPNEVADALDVDSKGDIFVFVFDKKNLTLKGTLENRDIWWQAVHGNKN